MVPFMGHRTNWCQLNCLSDLECNKFSSFFAMFHRFNREVYFHCLYREFDKMSKTDGASGLNHITDKSLKRDKAKIMKTKVYR